MTVAEQFLVIFASVMGNSMAKSRDLRKVAATSKKITLDEVHPKVLQEMKNMHDNIQEIDDSEAQKRLVAIAYEKTALRFREELHENLAKEKENRSVYVTDHVKKHGNMHESRFSATDFQEILEWNEKANASFDQLPKQWIKKDADSVKQLLNNFSAVPASSVDKN